MHADDSCFICPTCARNSILLNVGPRNTEEMTSVHQGDLDKTELNLV